MIGVAVGALVLVGLYLVLTGMSGTVTPPAGDIPGDANRDGRVDEKDWATAQAAWDWQRGGAFMLANLDDDDRRAIFGLVPAQWTHYEGDRQEAQARKA